MTEFVYVWLTASKARPTTSNPRACRLAAVEVPSPAVVVPLSTRTLTPAGLTGLKFFCLLAFGSLTSCAIAAKTSLACGCSHWTQFELPVAGDCDELIHCALPV